MSTITVNDKKDFLRWFLNHYQLKKREAVWILNYLMSHDKIMEQVRFVDDAEFCPRGLVMSTDCSQNVAFRFYKEKIMTTDAEKAFHDIRLNRDEPIYVQLEFHKKHSTVSYHSILEDNPFTPKSVKIAKEHTQIVEEFLNYCLAVGTKERLKRNIDEALENKKKRTFNKLVKQYNAIEIPEGNFKILKHRPRE